MRISAGKLGLLALSLVSLLIGQLAGLLPTQAFAEETHLSQKINLALRRTAHQLLRQSGDYTSPIKPVKQLDAQTFVIQLDHAFDYDQLPSLLQESLRQHHIQTNYDVAVLDCRTGELQLGYNVLDLAAPDGVPCAGRQQKTGCYTVQVTFSLPPTPTQPTPVWWVMGLGGLLLGLGFIAWRRSAPRSTSDDAPALVSPKTAPIQLGNSTFDLSQQLLLSGAHEYKLTYREAKLLHFFSTRLNQVIERNLILQSVWEDEGIIVGRSIDVFVSRLRKMLQDDPSLRLMAVHGVGYRLEVVPASKLNRLQAD